MMKRTARYRVKKRDGRTEWLRGSKLARSIGRALAAARGGDWDGFDVEEWRTADLVAAVLTGVRKATGRNTILTAARLAVAVQKVLVATGFSRAAEAYSRASGEQRRRRLVLAAAMPRMHHDFVVRLDFAAAAKPPESQNTPGPPGGRENVEGGSDRSVNRRSV